MDTGAEGGGVAVAGHRVVAVTDHVAVAGGESAVADVAAGGHRAVTRGNHRVVVDDLVEVATVGVDVLVHRVIDVGVVLFDGGVVVGDVVVQVVPRVVVAVVVVRRRVVHPVVVVRVVAVRDQAQRVVHVGAGHVVEAALVEVAVGVGLEGGPCVGVAQQGEQPVQQRGRGSHRCDLLSSRTSLRCRTWVSDVVMCVCAAGRVLRR
jgi:hypothetical protein